MNPPRWLLLGAVLVGVVIGAIAVRTRSARTLEQGGAALPPDEATPRAQARSAMAAARPVPTAPSVTMTRTAGQVVAGSVRPMHEPEPAGALRVHAGAVLANVNGKPIELKDLLPLEAAEQEKTMTPDEFQSRLNRAIEMELTAQAAAASGVSLTAEQKRRVESLAQKQAATLQEYRQQGISWSSSTAAQLQFEKRVTSAQLLQQNLVASTAAVAPSADPAAQAQYEQALRDLLDRL